MIDSLRLQTYYFLDSSYTNGPGKRAVIYLKRTLPEAAHEYTSHNLAIPMNRTVSVQYMYQCIISLQHTIEGITIYGDDVLAQQESIHALLHELKANTSLSVILVSNDTVATMHACCPPHFILPFVDLVMTPLASSNEPTNMLLPAADTLERNVAPPFVWHSFVCHFLTPRYTPDDMHTIPTNEVIITEEGDVIMSGIDTLHYHQW